MKMAKSKTIIVLLILLISMGMLIGAFAQRSHEWSEINDVTVTLSQMDDDSVGADQIIDDSVGTFDIMDGAVSTDDVSFNFAGSGSKGGSATYALDADTVDGYDADDLLGGAGPWDNSTTAVYLKDPNDNVGIGTAGPGFPIFKLQIPNQTEFAAGYNLLLSSVGEADNNWTRWAMGGFYWDESTDEWVVATSNYDRAGILAVSNGGLAFITDAVNRSEDPRLTNAEFFALEKMRITSDGKVGIGTTSPGEELEVVGTVDADGLIISGSAEMTSVSTGTADNDKLVTKGYVDDNDDGGDFSDGGEAGGADRALGNTDNYDLGFLTNNNNRLHIQNDGNVGIGTANPKSFAKLEVNTTGSKSIYTMDSSNGGLLIGYLGPSIQGRDTSHANSDLYLNNYGGNVGVGTDSPSYKLDVSGTGRFTSTLYLGGNRYLGSNSFEDTDGDLYIQYHTADGDVQIGDSGTDHKLSVYGDGFFNGDVGIGTASPGEELEVVGTVDADGLIISGSAEMTSVSTGTADNDKLVTKGYVDDNAGVLSGYNIQVYSHQPEARAGCGAAYMVIGGGCVSSGTYSIRDSYPSTESDDSDSAGTAVSDGDTEARSWSCVGNAAATLTAYAICASVS